MELKELTYLLQHPEHITSEQTHAIKELIEQYPYFQPARAIYLKGLKNKESFKYNHALKTTAAYTTDRSVLFDYITTETFNQNEISQLIKQNAEYLKNVKVIGADDISVNTSVEIDDALRQQIKETEGVLDPFLFEEKPTTIAFSDVNKTDEQAKTEHLPEGTYATTPEETLNLGKPLEFDQNERHSFTEWLNLTNFKPIYREDEPEDNENKEVNNENDSVPLKRKIDLIDKFIKDNPKISPITDRSLKPKLIEDSEPDISSLMTETLARIYLEQKNYDKAIQSYKILSLKYPEKSSFFATQIEAVKELKENNKI